MTDDSSTRQPSSTTTSPESTDCGSTVAETVDESQQTVPSPPSSVTSSDITVLQVQQTLPAVPPVFAPTAVPVNTRATGSDAGEGPSNSSSSSSSDHLSGLLPAFDLALGRQTPLPPSEPDTSEGGTHLRGPLRSELSLHKQLFKAPPSKPAKPAKRKKPEQALIRDAGESAVSPTPLRHDELPPATEHVHEQSTWITVALEDIDRGLKRLTMAAKDQRMIDSSKTAEQHYSGYLARAIKAQELQLDPEELK